MTIDDAVLIAYADGELPEIERAAVADAINADPRLADRLAAHRALANQINAAFAGVVLEPVPDRLTAAVGLQRAPTPVGMVIPFPARRAPLRQGLWVGAATGAAAACLALGLMVGGLGPGAQGGWIGPDLSARGALAQALNTQLASAQDGAAIKIGITFRAADGPLCRTFASVQGPGAAGLACRKGSVWTVRMLVPSAGPAGVGVYQTAASSLPSPVAALAQTLAVGSPLDGTAEARAKAAGWR